MIYMRLLLILMVASIAGCGTVRQAGPNEADYLKQAKSVPPARIPANLSSSNIQTYYPIPPVTMGPAVQQPSLLPPGSVIATNQQAQQRNVQVVQPQPGVVVSDSGNMLVLGVNYVQGWQRVGIALRKAGYKIMQQDSSLGSYFILDTASTGGKLKVNTPIYQVHLASANNNTSVTVLNDKSQAASNNVAARILSAIKQKL